MLQLFLIVSIVGFLLSIFIHFGTIFNIIIPHKDLIVLINVGAVFVLYPTFIMRNKICGKNNAKDFNKALFGICPQWMKVITGILVMYALVGLIYFIVKRHSSIDGTVVNNFRGFTGHWMALYFLAFTILYSCGKLKKRNNLTEDKSC